MTKVEQAFAKLPQYEAVGTLKVLGTFTEYKDAVLAVIDHVRDTMADKRNSTVSLQWLETCNYVVEKGKLPQFFYELRDTAARNKWIDKRGLRI